MSAEANALPPEKLTIAYCSLACNGKPLLIKGSSREQHDIRKRYRQCPAALLTQEGEVAEREMAQQWMMEDNDAHINQTHHWEGGGDGSNNNNNNHNGFDKTMADAAGGMATTERGCGAIVKVMVQNQGRL